MVHGPTHRFKRPKLRALVLNSYTGSQLIVYHPSFSLNILWERRSSSDPFAVVFDQIYDVFDLHCFDLINQDTSL
ncbi:hypothetical protein L6452_16477 [Arctium lappa]|uniref:Uncharacterized protein n=1 Tax=Arctium lappa TaxID=4217 RepID=A0ACB9C126_ARCLA|nr:hypothetical protein L6452_16477 [Arctium lappa]